MCHDKKGLLNDGVKLQAKKCKVCLICAGNETENSKCVKNVPLGYAMAYIIAASNICMYYGPPFENTPPSK